MSQRRIEFRRRETVWKFPLYCLETAVLALLIIIPCGCKKNELYVVTDEPTAISVRGIELTDENILALEQSEAAAREKLSSGDFLGAAAEYEKQLPLLSDHFVVEFKLCTAHAQAGDADESLSWLSKSVAKGFTNVGKLDSDPALEILRGDKRTVSLYRDAHENMIALRSKIVLDPWSGPSKTVPAFDSLDELISIFDQRGQALERLKNVFFPREAAIRRNMNDRMKADALGRFLDDNPRSEEAESAQMELIRIYNLNVQNPGASEAVLAKLDESCRKYLETYSEGEHRPAVLFIQSEYQFSRDFRKLAGLRKEETARLVGQFRQTLEELVSKHPGTSAAGQSLVWLAELDLFGKYGERDLDGAMESFTLLQEEYFDQPEVKAFAEKRIFPLWVLSQGMPEFDVEAVTGEAISSNSFRGQVLLIHFWATTSGPSKDEIPNLKWINEKFEGQDLAMFGVSMDLSERMAKPDFLRWLDVNGLSWPQYYDGKGLDNELARMFQVASIPFTILVDREGSVVDVGLSGKELEQALEAIID